MNLWRGVRVIHNLLGSRKLGEGEASSHDLGFHFRQWVFGDRSPEIFPGAEALPSPWGHFVQGLAGGQEHWSIPACSIH